MSNLNNMAKNIDALLTDIRLAILKEVLQFCDTVNSNVPENERYEFCHTCKYGLLCDAINSQLDVLRNFEFLINKEI